MMTMVAMITLQLHNYIVLAVLIIYTNCVDLINDRNGHHPMYYHSLTSLVYIKMEALFVMMQGVAFLSRAQYYVKLIRFGQLFK